MKERLSLEAKAQETIRLRMENEESQWEKCRRQKFCISEVQRVGLGSKQDGIGVKQYKGK